MVKNKGGGNRHKKSKNHIVQNDTIEFLSDSHDEHYALVIKPYGNGQFGVNLVVSDANGKPVLTTKEYRGRLSGRMRKQKRRNFVRKDDFVLISKRSFEEDKVDIIHVYRPSDVRTLTKMGKIPDVERVGCMDDGTNFKSAFEFSDDVASSVNTGTPNDTTQVSANNGVPPKENRPTKQSNDTTDEWEISIDDI